MCKTTFEKFLLCSEKVVWLNNETTSGKTNCRNVSIFWVIYFLSMFKNRTSNYSFPIENDGQKVTIQQNKHWKKSNTTNLKLINVFENLISHGVLVDLQWKSDVTYFLTLPLNFKQLCIDNVRGSVLHSSMSDVQSSDVGVSVCHRRNNSFNQTYLRAKQEFMSLREWWMIVDRYWSFTDIVLFENSCWITTC